MQERCIETNKSERYNESMSETTRKGHRAAIHRARRFTACNLEAGREVHDKVTE
ncbi:hypothetical protein GUITHDRAFT_152248 [Guillardia theta CCMP2712]|uniref:Uncharacterized protein n=1 Tax=Guillardia theta (strain CCMP2712) TaxID=905079 RepID=L1JEG9_GUITC|nr:hypothetical protein GUITHDRAFT_152248 [Guillardia theta CCMP2712]EKX46923.1 hypothetical protein GUITHDRAFT_152248 [Guillardia theta CCMP2712]|eukprot:XP_005833903.1 hypothetical protein GUITHDRAFT_152248 [Guillardia theta CCMP2712]